MQRATRLFLDGSALISSRQQLQGGMLRREPDPRGRRRGGAPRLEEGLAPHSAGFAMRPVTPRGATRATHATRASDELAERADGGARFSSRRGDSQLRALLPESTVGTAGSGMPLVEGVSVAPHDSLLSQHARRLDEAALGLERMLKPGAPAREARAKGASGYADTRRPSERALRAALLNGGVAEGNTTKHQHQPRRRTSR